MREHGTGHILAGAAAWLERGLQIVTGAIMVVEIAVLFAGVLARYVFHAPLVWSDEVASILFLWLGMLGGALALAEGSNLRTTAIVTRLPRPIRNHLECVPLAVAIGFIVLLLPPSYHYFRVESLGVTLTLGLPMAWQAAAMPIGLVLMLLAALFRAFAQKPWPMIVTLAVVAAACLAIHLLDPEIAALGNLDLVIFFLGLTPLLIFAGVPIAFSFGSGTLGYILVATRVPASIVVARMAAGMSEFLLLAIPLFVFLGLMIEMTGIAEKIVQFLAQLLGHTKGGLYYVLVGAMYLVSGISGSKAADIAAIAPALFPELEKHGKDRAELTALLAATGAQTETIPPSIILIALGSVTGLSISALFRGGILPALVVGLMLCTLVWVRTRRSRPTRVARADLGSIVISFVVALPALILPFVIRAAVVDGVATATEVSTIGIAYTLVVGLLIYRRFSLARLIRMLAAAAALSGAILIIVGFATAMGWAITQSGFSQGLAALFDTLPGGGSIFLAASIVLFAIVGSVLEGLPAVVLFGPLMFPIARHFQINEIHYAMVAILSMGLGLFTPPFGIGYYITCAIARVNSDDPLRHIWGYLGVLAVGIVVIAAVPWFSTGFIR